MWTINQQKAIDLEGTNIIVSAGAGSGKTAVLSERVLRKVKSGIHINELLVLTFTKAAAAEMKERIRNKLLEENLTNEANLIESAYITTFDAYSLALVKKYHTKLNISNDISITNELLINFEKKKILEKIMNDNYLSPQKSFLKLINNFCLKDDEKLKTYILNIYEKLELKYDKSNYLDNYIDNYYNEENINKLLKEYFNVLKEKIRQMLDITKELSLYLDSNYIEEINKYLDNLINSKNYLEIKNNILDRLKPLPRNSPEEAKKIKEELTSLNKELKDLTIYSNEEEIKEEIYSTKEETEHLIKILKQLDKELTTFKKENNFYTFNDISKMAIDVIVENEDVRKEVSSSFQEILVDEYQDTSDIQEKFISLIENNNVYMVGDIKQSIYRFRNANPYIFKNKYDTYTNSSLGVKIDLLENFRSRDEVLNNINMIFSSIMDEEIGGADYKKSHKMVFGFTDYKEKYNNKTDNNIEIYTYKDNIKSGKKDELEAFIIGSDIKNKIDSNLEVYDKDKKVLRKATYSDFVILIDKGKSFDLYKKIFEYLKIPLSILREEKLGKDNDLLVIKNLLRLLICIKNNDYTMSFKYSFASLSRSFLFKMTDNELYEVFVNDTFKETPIYKKCLNLVSLLDTLSPSEYLYYILEELNYDEALISLGNINSLRIREEYIYNLVKEYEETGKTIYDFADYLDELFDKSLDLKFDHKEDLNNSVRIMTIHKSKGLEYPICYFAGFSNKFNLSELKDRIIFDNKYGIILPKVDGYYKDTIVKTLLKNTTRKEEIAEKIRLLYVAMTRAREKMIIVTKTIEEKESDTVNSYEKYKYDTFYSILRSIYPKLEKYIKVSEVEVNEDYKNINKKINITPTNEKLIVEEDHIEYEEIENTHYSKETHLITKEEKEVMKFGEDVHKVLEEIDFTKPYFSSFNIEEKIINKIKDFLNTPLIKENINNKMYKEYEFFYEDSTLSHGIIDLLIEKEKEMIIIDYKLKNIEDAAYDKQLNGYREFIEKKTKKEVKCYLYSIIDNKFREVFNDKDLLCLSR